jgi:hypothetical protein
VTGEFPSIGAIEAMLRTATGDPAPSPDVIRLGMLRLETAMRSEVTADARRLRPRRWSRAVAVAGLAAAIVVVGTVVVPDQVSALAQLAEVAESVLPVEAGVGTFVYRVSDQTGLASVSAADLGQPGLGDISYLRNVRSRTWEAADTVRLETELGPLEFFSPADAAAFNSSPLAAQDRPGTVTVSETARVPNDLDARPWPVTTDELRRAMEAHVSNEPSDVPMAVRLMGLAGNLLRDPRIDAPLRAAVLRVLDDVEGIEVSEVDGVVTASARHLVPSGATAVTSMEFDESAHLVRESEVWVEVPAGLGIPPGTVVFDNRHSIPEVVDEID